MKLFNCVFILINKVGDDPVNIATNPTMQSLVAPATPSSMLQLPFDFELESFSFSI